MVLWWLADLRNKLTLERNDLILIIKVNHRGQVTDFLDSRHSDVRIDTKIKSIACIQPEISKVIRNMYMTLSSKLKRLRNVNYFNICDIPGLENVIIDTKIISVWCLQSEIRKVIQKCVWLSFSKSTIKVKWLILDFLRSSTLWMLESIPRSSL